MIIVQNAILSDDIAEKFFVCHLESCKGACCVEGDAGAPLAQDEQEILRQEYEKIKPFLSPQGIEAIAQQGLFVSDQEKDISTPLLASGACAYSLVQEGKLACGIEQAFLAGKTHFRKPISCHLYPIRIQKYDEFEALNYHRWEICQAACSLGEKLGVPLYQFLKQALVRKYGQDWYDELEEEIRKKTIPQ